MPSPILWDSILVDAIVTLWPESSGTLSSAHLYHYLQERHTPPPPSNMHILLTSLQQTEQIAGVAGINPVSLATHGALMITWVNPNLLTGRRREHELPQHAEA
jgi:hypothetical protein